MAARVKFTAAKLRRGYLPTLDGWRCLAILAVLIDHGTLGFPTLQRYSPVRLGPNGVSLFFAISGFLICSRLLEEFEQAGGISLKGFYIRRACRILPAASANPTLCDRDFERDRIFTGRSVRSVEFRPFLSQLSTCRSDNQRLGGYTIHYRSSGGRTFLSAVARHGCVCGTSVGPMAGYCTCSVGGRLAVVPVTK